MYWTMAKAGPRRYKAREKLTARQERFVEGVATPGLTTTDAARQAGYQDPGNQGSRLLTRPKILLALERTLKANGITYARLGRKLRHKLDATKGVYFEGRKVAVEDHHEVQLDAVKTGYKLYGHLASALPVNVNVQQATMVQHITIRTDIPREELARELIARLSRRAPRATDGS